MPDIKMIHGDCMEIMKQYPDKYFQLACVDPPYGIGGGSNTKMKSTWDSDIPKKEYFSELCRVSKNQIIWGGNYFPLPSSRCWIIWDKQQPVDNFADGEMAWTNFDEVVSFFRYSFSANKGKIHPTQKPVALYKWLLSRYAKPGDRILDTHLGSGSSRIAAYELGFDFYATELDSDYFAAQEKRFADYKAQMTLFAPEEIRQDKQIELI